MAVSTVFKAINILILFNNNCHTNTFVGNDEMLNIL